MPESKIILVNQKINEGIFEVSQNKGLCQSFRAWSKGYKPTSLSQTEEATVGMTTRNMTAEESNDA